MRYVRIERDTEPGVCARSTVSQGAIVGRAESAISGCGFSDLLTLCDCGQGRITVIPEDWHESAAGLAGTPAAAAPGARARCRQRRAELDRSERIAISGVPSPQAVAHLAEQGVTHVVNCRPRAPVRWSGDLAAERAAFGPGRVAHAPMQDHGRRQRPAVWAAAACFAARVLDDQPHAGVLIHCSAGRRRSAMLAYAVLRLRGHDRTRAAALVLRYRPRAQLVPA
jgi:protein tyrosine phosphatase (PTP) superfamily phosphohydrolase (DUF442 family)